VMSGPVTAHGGEPTLRVYPDRLRAGMALEVTAENVPPEAPVTLALRGGSGSWAELGSITSDPDGHLAGAVVIPPGTPTGTYLLGATWTGGGAPAAALVVTAPSPAGEPLAQGERDEDDPLLAPLPAGWQRSDGRVATVASVVPATSISPVVPLIVAAAIALGLGAAVLAGARRRG
jgi:hypothetical protein